MSLRPFTVDDISRIDPQPSQALDTRARERILRDSVRRGPCWTYEAADGRVLCIGGMVTMHESWATAWTIIAADLGAQMVGLTRAVAGIVRATARELGEDARVDMHVDPHAIEAVRWAMMLGFRQEAWLDRAMPGGGALTVWTYERGPRG